MPFNEKEVILNGCFLSWSIFHIKDWNYEKAIILDFFWTFFVFLITKGLIYQALRWKKKKKKEWKLN